MAELPTSIHLEVVTPLGLIVETTCEEVIAPGFAGQFGARPGHQPYLVQLKPGAIGYRAAGRTRWLAISGGTAEVNADRIVVLADAAEPADGIDIERAQNAQKRAQEWLSDRSTDGSVDQRRALDALARAESRLRVIANK